MRKKPVPSTTPAVVNPVPKPIRHRSGCKVGWDTYATHEEATLASEIAKKNAIEAAALGFDFGYCMPGSIKKVSWRTLDKPAQFKHCAGHGSVFTKNAGTEVAYDEELGHIKFWDAPAYIPIDPYVPCTKHEGWEVCIP